MTRKKRDIQDENIKYIKHQSNGSCYVHEIESFVYGATTSRFWSLRKHINSTDIKPSIK